MNTRFDWSGIGPLRFVRSVAVALTAWQARVDRSVVERVVGVLDPVAVVTATAAPVIVDEQQFRFLGLTDCRAQRGLRPWACGLVSAEDRISNDERSPR